MGNGIKTDSHRVLELVDPVRDPPGVGRFPDGELRRVLGEVGPEQVLARLPAGREPRLEQVGARVAQVALEVEEVAQRRHEVQEDVRVLRNGSQARGKEEQEHGSTSASVGASLQRKLAPCFSPRSAWIERNVRTETRS